MQHTLAFFTSRKWHRHRSRSSNAALGIHGRHDRDRRYVATFEHRLSKCERFSGGSSECDFGALSEIDARRVPRPPICFQLNWQSRYLSLSVH